MGNQMDQKLLFVEQFGGKIKMLIHGLSQIKQIIFLMKIYQIIMLTIKMEW